MGKKLIPDEIRENISSSRIICVMGTMQAVFAMRSLSAIIRF